MDLLFSNDSWSGNLTSVAVFCADKGTAGVGGKRGGVCPADRGGGLARQSEGLRRDPFFQLAGGNTLLLHAILYNLLMSTCFTLGRLLFHAFSRKCQAFIKRGGGGTCVLRLETDSLLHSPLSLLFKLLFCSNKDNLQLYVFP